MSLFPPCPVCGNTSSPLFCAGEHRMFRCNGCALGFVAPVPTDEFLASFYSRFHTSLEAGGGYDLNEARMEADFPAKIKKIRSEFTSSGFRLLDVGCGRGFFVRACRDARIEAQGIDLSDTAISYAVNELGVNATCSRIEDVADALGHFDVVTFWATIEHLPCPVETLRAIHKVLKPGGILLLDTGIGDDWLDRLLPGVNQWYDPPQHLYVFSTVAMRLALSQAGFVVVDIDENFERNIIRRGLRVVRGFVAALGLRTVAELTRCAPRKSGFGFTRFPLGNLMAIVARKLP